MKTKENSLQCTCEFTCMYIVSCLLTPWLTILYISLPSFQRIEIPPLNYSQLKYISVCLSDIIYKSLSVLPQVSKQEFKLEMDTELRFEVDAESTVHIEVRNVTLPFILFK